MIKSVPLGSDFLPVKRGEGMAEIRVVSTEYEQDDIGKMDESLTTGGYIIVRARAWMNTSETER